MKVSSLVGYILNQSHPSGLWHSELASPVPVRTIMQGQKYKYLLKKVTGERKLRTGEDCPWVTHLKMHLGHLAPSTCLWVGLMGQWLQ